MTRKSSLATATAAAAAAALAATTILAACAGSPAQESVNQSHAAALHAAAACIRAHGIPSYSDPVLTPDGHVYTDSRPFDNAGQAVIRAVSSACRTLIVRANLNPDAEPPAPAALVQAGVRTAECERAHGMPAVADPTARSTYTPGHGFGLRADEVPVGGKQSAGFQQSLRDCHSQIDAEIRASTLGSLGSNG